jgi:hypothetical protein
MRFVEVHCSRIRQSGGGPDQERESGLRQVSENETSQARPLTLRRHTRVVSAERRGTSNQGRPSRAIRSVFV